MKSEYRNKIIEKGIILEEEWDKASDQHIALAIAIVDFLEKNKDNEDFEFSEYDSFEFRQEFLEIQDKIELNEIDKVKEDKENDFVSIKMKIPAAFAKYLQDVVFPSMIDDVNNED